LGSKGVEVLVAGPCPGDGGLAGEEGHLILELPWLSWSKGGLVDLLRVMPVGLVEDRELSWLPIALGSGSACLACLRMLLRDLLVIGLALVLLGKSLSLRS
jgi:hypothetical protein